MEIKISEVDCMKIEHNTHRVLRQNFVLNQWNHPFARRSFWLNKREYRSIPIDSTYCSEIGTSCVDTACLFVFESSHTPWPGRVPRIDTNRVRDGY
jgi:hypothetical protein